MAILVPSAEMCPWSIIDKLVKQTDYRIYSPDSQGKHNSTFHIKGEPSGCRELFWTLKSSFLNQFNPHPPFISCSQRYPISQMMKAPQTPAVYQEVQVSAARPGKTGNRLLLGQRSEQTAHTSQSQSEPVCATLKSSPPLSRQSWHKEENINDSNLWPSNQERTCEGEWFADEGDIKETKPG